MNYWLILITGLTSGGVTCAAMQGGLLASLIANQKKEKAHSGFGLDDWGPAAAFMSTKLVSHIILGFLLGALGSVVQLSLPVRLFLQGFAAVFMLATAANLLDIHPVFRYLAIQPPKFVYRLIKNNSQSASLFAPAMLGFITVLIPCGVTQAMAVLAINSGSPAQGAAIMGTFVLGTSPMFFLIGLATARFSEVWRRDFLRFAAIALVIMSVVAINGILLVADSPYSMERLGPKIVKLLPPYEKTTKVAVQDPNVSLVDGVQKVKISVENGGYTPKYFKVKSGLPVELTVEAGANVFSCASAFTFKAFNIYDELTPSDSRVHKFTPRRKGLYTFACSMGMYSGTMEVI